MRDAILELLRENKGNFVSGQRMSEHCDVSRTAIWKHIEALRKKGYVIESFTKKGYRLMEEPDVMSWLEMESVLTTKTFGRNYQYLESVESTNRIGRDLANEGAPEGTVVVAEEQVAGRGRLDRGWYSPYGKGLWFSIILRPKFLPIEAPKCTLMAAVALIKAFRRLGLQTAGIKWPNDILVNGRKLVGILTEMNGSMEEISYIVMGIGINTSSTLEEIPDFLKDIATSFAMEGVEVDRREALNTILEELEMQYNKVLAEGFNSTLAEWKELSITLGKQVEVRAPGSTYEGKAIDLDQDGNLMIERADGSVERVVAGDVSIRPAHKVGG
ncbi:biotin--[acetyl-CoA-carboxylase] ligase [Veillonella intestinalis]|uniref:biotin--[acetyl-CoA-carboxylase] ligase n=1 Tax=Veillonella intestinalis TaxID=2941341 RepID=UPI002041F035|nr:biotin--[acetyl-CoA-carboxylase] ligase [Veillonella intestinalis]